MIEILHDDLIHDDLIHKNNRNSGSTIHICTHITEMESCRSSVINRSMQGSYVTKAELEAASFYF